MVDGIWWKKITKRYFRRGAPMCAPLLCPTQRTVSGGANGIGARTESGRERNRGAHIGAPLPGVKTVVFPFDGVFDDIIGNGTI